MLKNKKLIRVRVRFPAARREYECGFSPQSTIAENLAILRRLIGDEVRSSYLSEGEEIVCDEDSSYVYDQNVSVGSIGIRDGTVLMVC